MLLGVWAAVCFASNFRGRGLARTIFVLPMMATPVAISLVWTMMFHPQLGVLNYLLSLRGPAAVGLGLRQRNTVIPTLVMVETWQWTPLVMLIVLGGIASLPQDPYEAAVLDGASAWQMFRHITLPLVWPFIVVAAVIRMIDALKAFDTIYVITLGGPGTASETLNILLYQTAFAYYDLGYGSAMVVVFFVLILLVSLLLLAHPAEGGAGNEPRDRASRLHRLARHGRAVFLGPGADLAGDPVLPVDAVAGAEERGRQHRLPAGVHSQPADPRQLHRRVREERLPDLHDQLGDRVVHRHRAGAAARGAGGLRHRQGEGHARRRC